MSWAANGTLILACRGRGLSGQVSWPVLSWPAWVPPPCPAQPGWAAGSQKAGTQRLWPLPPSLCVAPSAVTQGHGNPFSYEPSRQVFGLWVGRTLPWLGAGSRLSASEHPARPMGKCGVTAAQGEAPLRALPSPPQTLPLKTFLFCVQGKLLLDSL